MYYEIDKNCGGESMAKIKSLETIGFRVYVFKGGYLRDDIKGNVVLLDKSGKQIASKMFNHWDELIIAIRKLIRRAGYRKVWQDGYWAFEQR